jgi:hypothetical protein
MLCINTCQRTRPAGGEYGKKHNAGIPKTLKRREIASGNKK